MAKFEVADQRKIPKCQIAVFDIKLVGNVAEFDFIGDGHQQEAIPPRIKSESAQFDPIIEVLELVARYVGRRIDLNFGADFCAQLGLFEMEDLMIVSAINPFAEFGQRARNQRLDASQEGL